MTRLPATSGRAVARALGKSGFEEVSTRGSHVKLRNAVGRTVIVPLHDELARGTLRSILRQADLTVEELVRHLQ